MNNYRFFYSQAIFALVVAFQLSFSLSLDAQTPPPDSTSILSPKEMLFMCGTWKGEGWILQNRQRHTFIQEEMIMAKIDSQVLVVDGIGFAKDSFPDKKHVIHQAFGVIAFNPDLGTVSMLSYSAVGGKKETPMKRIGEKQLQWSFKDERGGTVRFSEDFSEEGVWKEKGEYSFDGKSWFPFFEMQLTRQ